jgi:phosphoserine phosphatase
MPLPLNPQEELTMSTLAQTPMVSLHMEWLYPIAYAAMEAEQNNQNFIADLSDLAASLEHYLNLIDGDQSDDTNELDLRFQALSKIFKQVVALHSDVLID